MVELHVKGPNGTNYVIRDHADKMPPSTLSIPFAEERPSPATTRPMTFIAAVQSLHNTHITAATPMRTIQVEELCEMSLTQAVEILEQQLRDAYACLPSAVRVSNNWNMSSEGIGFRQYLC